MFFITATDSCRMQYCISSVYISSAQLHSGSFFFPSREAFVVKNENQKNTTHTHVWMDKTSSHLPTLTMPSITLQLCIKSCGGSYEILSLSFVTRTTALLHYESKPSSHRNVKHK